MKIVLLESIRSMQNVWAVFRNADWAWFDKVILTGYTPFPPRKEIYKTALWAQNSIIWEYYEDPFEVLNILKNDWYKIYSVELTENSEDYRNFFWKNHENICLVMWNEVAWVSKEVLDFSDKAIHIPMHWIKESLNVSVAAGIVMYAFAE